MSGSPRSRGTSSSASPSDAPARARRLTLAVATVLGTGWAPVAPGTVASAITGLVVWGLFGSRAWRLAFFVAVTVVGSWAAHHAERYLGEKDPSAIVIDEVAGMTLTVLPFPSTPSVLIAGFVLFRLFDVLKPFPAHDAQRLPGGAGIMVDDLIAGLYALAVVAAGRALIGWP